MSATQITYERDLGRGSALVVEVVPLMDGGFASIEVYRRGPRGGRYRICHVGSERAAREQIKYFDEIRRELSLALAEHGRGER